MFFWLKSCRPSAALEAGRARCGARATAFGIAPPKVNLSIKARGELRLPRHFDLREVAPTCILPVRRQGRCVAAWAMVAVGSFEKQASGAGDPALRLGVRALLAES